MSRLSGTSVIIPGPNGCYDFASLLSMLAPVPVLIDGMSIDCYCHCHLKPHSSCNDWELQEHILVRPGVGDTCMTCLRVAGLLVRRTIPSTSH